MKTLDRLQITRKVPNANRLDTKPLVQSMIKMIESEKAKDLKKLFVPDHFLCLIGGEIMHDPVTIESGRTFERDNITQYFEVQR